jgi:hypothetical protein
VFPQAQVQTCIVHLIRHSLAFVSYKDRKAVAVALKTIYRAKDAEAGPAALEAFAEGPWNSKYPAIAPAWRRAWGEVIPFYAFPDEVRRIIYTTDEIDNAPRASHGVFLSGVGTSLSTAWALRPELGRSLHCRSTDPRGDFVDGFLGPLRIQCLTM